MTHSVTDEVPQHRDNQGPSRPSTLAKTLHEERKRKLWAENMPSLPPVPICMISRLVYLFKKRSKPVRLDMKKKSDLKYRGIDILGSLSLVCCLPIAVEPVFTPRPISQTSLAATLLVGNYSVSTTLGCTTKVLRTSAPPSLRPVSSGPRRQRSLNLC